MNKLFELTFGSRMYGTETENSDLDLKGLYLPTAREIVLNTYKKTISTQRPKGVGERNNKDDVDVEYFSVDRYLQLLAQGQTVALDILFAPSNMFNWKAFGDYTFEYIKANKDKLVSKDLTSFIGYAKQQAAKYGLKGFRVAALRDTIEFLEKLPQHETLEHHLTFLKIFVYKYPFGMENTELLNNEYVTLETLEDKSGANPRLYLKVCDKYYQTNSKIKDIKEQIQKRFDQYGARALKAEQNEGQDNKALSHAVRVNSQGIELLQTGNITFPRPDRELLLQIKTGQMHYNDVADIIVDGLDKLKAAQLTSTLREKPDQEWIDNFTYELYSDIVKGE